MGGGGRGGGWGWVRWFVQYSLTGAEIGIGLSHAFTLEQLNAATWVYMISF